MPLPCLTSRHPLTAPRVEGSVAVGGTDGKDPRRLSFAEFGRPNGRPVFWLHGTPGARRQIPEAARIAAVELDVRLIGVDRPGVGSSTPHLYEQVLDFADDLAVLADALGVVDFSMIGLSGGGPYVLACAAALPKRVRSVGVLGGVAPSQGPDAPRGGIVSLAGRFHPVLEALRLPLSLSLAGFVWSVRPAATPALHVYARLSPEPDRRMLARPEFRAMFLDDLMNGSRAGLRAPVDDVLLFGKSWGFSPRDLNVPVHWWHGDVDHLIPFEHGRHMAKLIPGAQLHVVHGESHLGTLAEAEDILATVLAAREGTNRRTNTRAQAQR
jgi:pimeloyl-ACP methyl ester carboxylesterase